MVLRQYCHDMQFSVPTARSAAFCSKSLLISNPDNICNTLHCTKFWDLLRSSLFLYFLLHYDIHTRPWNVHTQHYFKHKIYVKNITRTFAFFGDLFCKAPRNVVVFGVALLLRLQCEGYWNEYFSA